MSAPQPVKEKSRKTYSYNLGYCYIPKETWRHCLEKRPGQKIPFHVSSLRHALIVPAGYGYPHLTLDIQETRFIARPASQGGECVAVRINHMHLSPAENFPRIAFVCHGLDIIPEYPVPEAICHEIQAYLGRTPLPYQLIPPVTHKFPPEVLQTKLLPLPGSPDSGSAPTLLKSARGKGKGKGQKKKGHQARARVKPPKGASPGRPGGCLPVPVDPDTVWREKLKVSNFMKGLDTLNLDILDDSVLQQAVHFYQMIKPTIDLRLDDYGNKVETRSKAVMDALGDSVRLSKTALTRDGRSRHRFMETAMAKTRREVVRAIQVGELREPYDADTLDMFDFELHNLLPEDLLPDSQAPLPSHVEAFDGYRAALLLGVKDLAMRCQEIRSAEHFGRAYFLSKHVGLLLAFMTPSLKSSVRPLEVFMARLQGHLMRKQDALRPDIIKDSVALKALHNSMEEVHGVSETSIQLFNDYATQLGAISTVLSGFQHAHWVRLPERIKEPLERLAMLDEKVPAHWPLCSDILRGIADIAEEIMRDSQIH
ncbi:hypothetical protein [Parendozoicomonas haliclonae]|uniref:Uncharacterized protein n=1 Tax=Parendozoicomonas haliclonae TaxID=1960125 RepID=A0A1X7AI30_9GAMM|nr:hypothetical protein [Parendozoicomonas haliclonae]SMA43098.1 hypothetical protein EHSB41UT_01554 [Parendozoicomonas haliclonae]